jgi:hypothetical protein
MIDLKQIKIVNNKCNIDIVINEGTTLFCFSSMLENKYHNCAIASIINAINEYEI